MSGFRVVEEFRFSMVEGPLSITVPGNYYEGNDERRMAAFLKGIASQYRSLAEDEGYDEQTFHLEIAAGMVTVEVPALSECETRLAADFLSLVARVFDPSSGSTVATRTKRPAKRKAVSA